VCAALPRNAHTSDAALHRRRARRRLGRCKGVEVAPAAELSERGHREPDVSCGRLGGAEREEEDGGPHHLEVARVGAVVVEGVGDQPGGRVGRAGRRAAQRAELERESQLGGPKDSVSTGASRRWVERRGRPALMRSPCKSLRCRALPDTATTQTRYKLKDKQSSLNCYTQLARSPALRKSSRRRLQRPLAAQQRRGGGGRWVCAALPRNAHTSDAALHRRRARRRLGRCKGVEVAPAAELSERGHREPDVSCGRLGGAEREEEDGGPHHRNRWHGARLVSVGGGARQSGAARREMAFGLTGFAMRSDPFSLLGEKGEVVVFSRPLRALRARKRALHGDRGCRVALRKRFLFPTSAPPPPRKRAW